MTCREVWGEHPYRLIDDGVSVDHIADFVALAMLEGEDLEAERNKHGH